MGSRPVDIAESDLESGCRGHALVAGCHRRRRARRTFRHRTADGRPRAVRTAGRCQDATMPGTGRRTSAWQSWGACRTGGQLPDQNATWCRAAKPVSTPRLRCLERHHLPAVVERRPAQRRRRRVAAGGEVDPRRPHGVGELLLLGTERFLDERVRQVEQVGELGPVRRYRRVERRREPGGRLVVVELVGVRRHPLGGPLVQLVRRGREVGVPDEGAERGGRRGRTRRAGTRLRSRPPEPRERRGWRRSSPGSSRA